jgi:hypothetical protein
LSLAKPSVCRRRTVPATNSALYNRRHEPKERQSVAHNCCQADRLLRHRLRYLGGLRGRRCAGLIRDNLLVGDSDGRSREPYFGQLPAGATGRQFASDNGRRRAKLTRAPAQCYETRQFLHQRTSSDNLGEFSRASSLAPK